MLVEVARVGLLKICGGRVLREGSRSGSLNLSVKSQGRFVAGKGEKEW